MVSVAARGVRGATVVMVLFVLIGLVNTVLSLASPASGHGWYSALIGVVSIGLAPAAAGAWNSRLRGGSRVPALVVLACGIVADAAVLWATKREGWSYMTGMHGVEVIWWALFLSWQVLSIAALTIGRTVRAA